VGRKIDEDEQIEYLLAGLNDPYNPLFTAIGANPDVKLTVSELYLQVVAYDNLIRLQRIYNFRCSMLVFTPFALCFVTLRGTFMHFPELTY
jgi:hypothetical protein